MKNSHLNKTLQYQHNQGSRLHISKHKAFLLAYFLRVKVYFVRKVGLSRQKEMDIPIKSLYNNIGTSRKPYLYPPAPETTRKCPDLYKSVHFLLEMFMFVKDFFSGKIKTHEINLIISVE